MMAERNEFVELPNTQDHWKDLKVELANLAEKKVKGLEAFEKVLSENDHWQSVSAPFTLLRQVLSRDQHFSEEYFCETLLPWIADKALQVEELFKDSVSGYKLPNLYKGRIEEVTLTRQQVCCLLALCFLNSFPLPQTRTYQHFTLALFLSFAFYASQRGKLLCILHYFDRIYEAEVSGNNEFLSMCISVLRHHVKEEDPTLSWAMCESPLNAFDSPMDGGLIEGAHGCLQVDFANAYIGGGVLSMGNVQEEIRFCINPECLVSLLVCEEMTDLESILITGAEQFTTYTGYGGSFKCTGSYKDTNPVDDRNHRKIYIVAIDATPFDSNPASQYRKPSIVRELDKAYSGFSHQLPDDKPTENSMTEVATGNWGCGMFGGNKHLKTLIQWMAASKAGRPLRYYTFREPQLSQEQMELTKALLEQKVTVGQLYKVLVSGKEALEKDTFTYVLDSLSKVNLKNDES